MAIVPSGVVHQQRIAKGVAKAAKLLTPQVVNIRYSFDEDWSGAGAIFFRVVLSDQASSRSHLHAVARKVRSTIFNEVKPDELGLQAYFNFRSESEQAKLQEEAWA
jgi:hypothetical protein